MDQDQTPYPPYEPCPCESEKKYKFCCYTKGFHYYKKADGEVVRQVPMSKRLRDHMGDHMKYLEKEVYGRPLRPNDSLFPNAGPLSLKEKMAETMKKAGVRPVLIYAFEKTGLILTEENKNLISDADLAEYQEACDEYYELHPEEDMDAS